MPVVKNLSVPTSSADANAPLPSSPATPKIFSYATYCGPSDFTPSPTEGFASTVCDDALYIFGGSGLEGGETSDLYSFCLKSGWQKVQLKSDEKPDPRVAAAMTTYNGKLYVFGGVNDVRGWMNDLYEFDIASSTWKRLHQQQNDSTFPSPRDKCSLVAYNEKLYLYGGFGPLQKSQDSSATPDDADSINSNGDGDAVTATVQDDADSKHSNGVCIAVPATDQDDADSKHSNGDGGAVQSTHQEKHTPTSDDAAVEATATEDTDEAAAVESNNDSNAELLAVLKTDQSAAEFVCLNDFFCYDLATAQWAPVECENRPDDSADCVPPGLAAYSVCALADKLIYFGGKNSHGQRTNNVYCYALGLKKWLPLEVRSEFRKPSGRSFHAASVVNDRYVVIFGGRDEDDWERDDLWMLDINNMHWLVSHCVGMPGVSAPCARFGQALAVLPDADARMHIVIYGGSAELDPATGVSQELLTDMYIVPVADVVTACLPVMNDLEESQPTSTQDKESPEQGAKNSSRSGSRSPPVKIQKCDDCIDL